MFNSNFSNRQQYIKTNHDLNQGPDTKLFAKGYSQKAEYDRKLEELSLTNNSIASGSLARKNILRASAKNSTGVSSYVTSSSIDYGTNDSEYNNPAKQVKDKLTANENMGKTMMPTMKNNNFNRNI